jgi:3-dehydroquinate synthase
MQSINIDIEPNPYPVYVGSEIYDHFSDILAQNFQGWQIAIITSRSIFELHGNKILRHINDAYQVEIIFAPDGESAKNIRQAHHIYTKLLEAKFERSSLIIAFGGGVIGDLAGFVAATFLRGVDFVQIPTTLLAQVDSSVGGKVGVNHQLGKNLIGAFKQPLFVFSDIAFLKTLDEPELRCGLGEIVKYGFIQRADFFKYFENHIEQALMYNTTVLEEMVKVSVACKAAVVAEDHQEKGVRMALNYGHTFGHALEKLYSFSGLKHGEAVVLGILCALEYCRLIGTIHMEDYHKGFHILKKIPVKYDKSKMDTEKLISFMALDKKVKDGKIRLVLVDKIGSFRFENESDRETIKQAYEILK